ncbi:MAG: pyridoxamine 5'-phosphate oxidase family protein [Deltaproteobacteria bacterium]|nr:pyridoxamine 5'-phosphate oxidase family protein [Deltaproteobacteria bacterium]
MRKKEKEITEASAIEAIIKKSLVCRLALSDDNFPYIVPLCFGYRDRVLYFHGSLKGKKIDIIKKNQNICFEFDINTEIVKAEDACHWSMKYRSVIGFGKAVLLEDQEEKRKALNIIMSQYSNGTFEFNDAILKKTFVIKIEIESMTGQQS